MQTAEEFWANWRDKTKLSALARHLVLSRQAVQQWTRVPEEHHVAVAAWYDVAPAVVRPDLYQTDA